MAKVVVEIHTKTLWYNVAIANLPSEATTRFALTDTDGFHYLGDPGPAGTCLQTFDLTPKNIAIGNPVPCSASPAVLRLFLESTNSEVHFELQMTADENVSVPPLPGNFHQTNGYLRVQAYSLKADGTKGVLLGEQELLGSTPHCDQQWHRVIVQLAAGGHSAGPVLSEHKGAKRELATTVH